LRRLEKIKDKIKRARARALLPTPISLKKGGRKEAAKLMYKKLKALNKEPPMALKSRQKRSGENE
jgi:hypothetical protein